MFVLVGRCFLQNILVKWKSKAELGRFILVSSSALHYGTVKLCQLLYGLPYNKSSGWSVGLSVCPSVSLSVNFVKKLPWVDYKGNIWNFTMIYNTSRNKCDNSDSIVISDSSDNSEKNEEEKCLWKTNLKKKYLWYFFVKIFVGEKKLR